MLAVVAVACTAGTAAASAKRQTLPHPGFRTVSVWDAADSLRMDVAVWYPAHRVPRDVQLEGWTIRVARDAAPVTGKHPVILLSHDASSSRLASHDLAAHLARHGFMVIAPTHPGDNIDDASRMLNATNLVERPRHLVRAFNEIAATALGEFMDHDRIGLLGVGVGAVSAWQVAGMELVPDFAAYCADTVSADPLCTPWATAFHERMERDFKGIRDAGQEPPLVSLLAVAPVPVPLPDESAAHDPGPPASAGDSGPPNAADGIPSSAPPSGPVATDEANRAADPTVLPGALTVDQAQSPAHHLDDRPNFRIRAVGFLTPGGIGLFSDEAIRGFRIPMAVVAAEERPRYGGVLRKLQGLLPDRPVARTVEGAAHDDLQPPCPPMFQESFAALCGQTGSLAAEARRIRNDVFTRFFGSHLFR